MPRIQYFTKNGIEVVGTTTVINRFKETGGLQGWNFKIGYGIGWRQAIQRAWTILEGQGTCSAKTLVEMLEVLDPKPDWKAKRAETEIAARIGKSVHEWIHADWQGEVAPAILADDESFVRKAFDSYLSWVASTRLEIRMAEHSLVSEHLLYGGTFDALGTVNGKTALLDYKTSAAIYSDYLIQGAAYTNLIEETWPEFRVDEFHLLRVDKTDASFHHHVWPREVIMTEPWRVFQEMLVLYRLDRSLQKRIS